MEEQSIFRAWRGFFIESAVFASGDLNLIVGDGTQPLAKILFEKPLSFFFFRESDYYDNMQYYRTDLLMPARSEDSGVFQLIAGSMIQSKKEKVAAASSTQFFLVSTPQECIEVEAHEIPYVVSL